MTHHTLAHPGAQHVNIVDAVTPSDDRVHQRHRLATRPERTRPSQRDQLVSGPLQAEMGGHRRRQQQPGVGHRTLIIEDHIEAVEPLASCHQERALPAGSLDVFANAIVPAERALLRGWSTHHPTITRWIQAQCSTDAPADATPPLDEALAGCALDEVAE